MNKDESFDQEIAIVGRAGRFPGAQTVEEFWHNLCQGKETIAFFSEQELISAGVDPAELNEPNYVRANGYLEGTELFDAAFFGYSPREASILDPQQRLFLEDAWHALENAGYDTERYPGRIGVYAGVNMNTYLLSNLYPNRSLRKTVGGFQLVLGNDKDYVATRVSYKLNLRGPSVNVQTACSTSLVAVHIASQSLLNGECDMALAGGVSITVPQKIGYFYQEGGVASPDGHCRSFDANAGGTVHGNGVGVVVLKRLSDALADGDHIYAVIKGSAVNNDGAAKVGFTAPSIDGQADVIAEALSMAEVEADTISYIETHGTATPLGDPIEIAALTKAFRASADAQGTCAIGSVKTNIGHLDTAAGVAGLIKTMLALEHRQLPPSLNFAQPNPKIDFAHSPFFVNTKLTEWDRGKTPRRAGVSSFGVGGTNAHLILEEAPPIEASGPSRPWQLITLSAKTPGSLENMTQNLVDYLKQKPETNLADLAYTYQVGRRSFSHRRMLVCRDVEDAIHALNAKDPQRVFTRFQELKERPVVFLFPGQGAQYVNMASELYAGEPVFRKQIDRCAELLKAHLGRDIRDLLYPEAARAEEATQLLNQTELTQPALFVVEYALAMLWMKWGVRPQAMLGHSIGEYVAACLAGVFSLKDALTLVAARGKLMQQLPRGAMLSVPCSPAAVQPLLGKQLALAAINASSLCVVSGPQDAINDLQSRLQGQGVDCRLLHTSHAFHSAMMEPIMKPFAGLVASVTLAPPAIPYISNVTGTWISAKEATDPYYWALHLRQTVHFAAGMDELLKETERILLEVGPGRTLSTLARQAIDVRTGRVVLTSLRHPQDQQSDTAFLLDTVGKLWLTGVQINWPQFSLHERRHRLPLPVYPFERQRYWIEAQEQVKQVTSSQTLPDERQEEGAAGQDSSMTLHARPALLNTYVEPSNETEQLIALIWQELLGIEQIGIHDNFFELGGHSLLAAQLISRLREAFSLEVPLRSLFEALTIAQLAQLIEAMIIEKIEELSEEEAQSLG